MSMNIGPTDGQGNGLLYVGFNQDQGMAAVISKYLENACITGISVRCGSASAVIGRETWYFQYFGGVI